MLIKEANKLWRSRATKTSDEEKRSAASSALEKAIAATSKNPLDYEYFADVAIYGIELKAWEVALEACEKSLKLRPRIWQFIRQIHCLCMLGRFGEAKEKHVALVARLSSTRICTLSYVFSFISQLDVFCVFCIAWYLVDS